MKNDRVIILDLGGPYTQLVARRVRQLQVLSEVMPHTTTAAELREMAPRGIILPGGATSASADWHPQVDKAIFDLGIPVLAIGHGMRLMVEALGGMATAADEHEGLRTLQADTSHSLFAGQPGAREAWMHQSFQEVQLPPGFSAIATADGCAIAALADDRRKLAGLQFHPEISHTQNGQAVLSAFLFQWCGCEGTWQMEHFAQQAIREIREAVGEGRVLLGLSGGVDSSVVAALLYRAIGDRLHCVFVDHGFMRKHEPQMVMDVFTRHFPVSLVAVDASQRFMDKLKGVTDPETKRKIIGAEFVAVFREEAAKLGKLEHFAQGTIYPDVIESGAAPGSTVIKSHHNVGGLPKELGFTSLIEPLRALFKDEVRKLGLVLGLPEEMVHRQPFPGPGLAIRVIGDLTPEKVQLVRESDAILREEIAAAGLAQHISQYFTVLTGIRSVGVSGDARSYDQVIAIRAVITDDFMTADWARIPYDTLEGISRRIVSEVEGISRVLLDVTGKPPASIEWE